MRMIDKIMRSMRNTGLLDGVSDEDCDTIATAALEALIIPTQTMLDSGWDCGSKYVWDGEPEEIWPLMVRAALNE